MSLQDWGAIGELLGGVAIIVSLLYVGLQIKHGNRETRASALQATLDSEMSLQAEAMRYAGTWKKIVTGAHLADGEETRRAILLYNMMMTLYQNRYYQFKTGYLEHAPITEEAVTWPMYEIWRASGGAKNRMAEFLEIEIDEERWPDIVEHCTFDYMKKNAATLSAFFGDLFKGGLKNFVYKGTNGRWRDTLSSEDIQKYENVASENLTPDCVHWHATGEIAG